MTIEVTSIRNVTVVTLHRPERLNAIDMAMAERLPKILDEAAGDDNAAVVITGTGRAFCAGSDLRDPALDGARKLELMHEVVQQLIGFPKVTVACLNGSAYGGGLEIAMACALRVASTGAKMGLPEIKLGAIPSYGGTQLLPRLIGGSRAMSMMLLGEPISAQEALACGLVNAIDEDPFERALTVATECSVGRQAAQRAIREAVHTSAETDLERGLALERRLAAEVAETDEVREGIARFLSRTVQSQSK